MQSGIPFDEGAAEALIIALEETAAWLHGQGFIRHGVVSHTVEEFSGGYAAAFTAACVVEAEDRGRFAGILEALADQVRGAKRRTEEEKKRLADLAAWRERKAARDRLLALAPMDGAGPLVEPYDPKPSEYPVAPPTLTAIFTPRERTRTFKGLSRTLRTSADPARLRYFVTQSRPMNAALSDELAALSDAWRRFTSACSWAPTGVVTFLTGFERLIVENQTDVIWIENIAAAFEAAGSGSLADLLLSSTMPIELASAEDTVESYDSLEFASGLSYDKLVEWMRSGDSQVIAEVARRNPSRFRSLLNNAIDVYRGNYWSVAPGVFNAISGEDGGATAAAALNMYLNFRSSEKWDMKVHLAEAYERSEYDGFFLLTDEHGRTVRSDVFGNVNYGIMLAHYGVPVDVALRAANVGGSTGIGDDDLDDRAVEFGYKLYFEHLEGLTKEQYYEAIANAKLTDL